jgi:hypothetical protein
MVLNAGMAQWRQHWFCKPTEKSHGGSSPSTSSKIMSHLNYFSVFI